MSLKRFYEQLALTPGVTAAQVAKLKKQGLSIEEVAARLTRHKESLPPGPHPFVTQACAGYPERLRQLHEPPLQIFFVGRPPQSITNTVVGVVGSRKASPHGLRWAREIGRMLTRRGVSVCSGLALGIDGAAHRGATEQLERDPSGGRPVAVLGHGLGRLHPSEHFNLARSVGQWGTLLTEFPGDFPPTQWTFPARNRIIAALSHHLVVVEAGARSGSLHTAKFANDLGRTLWVVPNAPGRPNSDGVLRLLKDGAQVLHDLEEFGETVAPSRRPATGKDQPPPLSPQKREILKLLDRADGQTDLLCRHSKLTATELACLLTELELDGHVQRQLDGTWAVHSRL